MHSASLVDAVGLRLSLSVTILWTAVLVTLALLSMPILASILPDSPLRSITGGIFPSPLMHGLPVIIATEILVGAMLYAYLSLHLTSPGRFCHMLTWGLRLYDIWIVVAMQLSFIPVTLLYVLL